MGKPATPAGMDRGELKAVLKYAKSEAVHVAFALGGDGKAILMADKRKQPRALEKSLKDDAPDSKNHRFGDASADPDDPKTLIFTVNKAANGVARKLVVALKGTGFSKVKLQLEDGTSVESAASEEDEDAETEAEGTPQAATSEQEAPTQASTDQPEPPVAPPDGTQQASAEASADAPAPGPVATDGQQQPESGPDPKALTAKLTELVKAMVPVLAANPAQKGPLTELAKNAQASLKGGDLEAASEAIQNLETALNDGASAPDAPGGGAPKLNLRALGTASKVWSVTRKKLEGDLKKLHTEMTTVYKDHGFGADLDKFFTKTVEPVMDSLDESLSKKLDALGSTEDPSEHAKLVSEAKQIMQKYQAYLASEPLIAKLDQNPFVPLQIQATLNTTLTSLAKVIN